jgi:alcohol dehydrogenase (NADP+)
MKLLDVGGTVIVIRPPEKEIFSLVSARHSLAGSVIGGIRETQEMLDFCSKNNIASDIEIIPIQTVNEAYERVVNSDDRYRFVMDMKSLDSKD